MPKRTNGTETAPPKPPAPRRLNALEQAAMNFFEAEIDKATKTLTGWAEARAQAMVASGIPGDGSKVIVDGLVLDNPRRMHPQPPPMMQPEEPTKTPAQLRAEMGEAMSDDAQAATGQASPADETEAAS